MKTPKKLDLLARAVRLTACPAREFASDAPVVSVGEIITFTERLKENKLSIDDGRVVLDYGNGYVQVRTGPSAHPSPETT